MRYLLMMFLGWLPMLASAVAFDESTQSLPLGRVMQVFVRPRLSRSEITRLSRFLPGLNWLLCRRRW